MTVAEQLDAEWMRTAEIAKLLRVNVDTAKRLFRENRLPGRYFGNIIIYLRAAVETFASTYDPTPGQTAAPVHACRICNRTSKETRVHNKRLICSACERWEQNRAAGIPEAGRRVRVPA